MRAGARVAAVVCAGLALGAAARASAQERRAYVRDAGPGVAGRLLAEILGRPHTLIVAPDTGIVLGRGTDVPTSLVVVGGPARLEGRVRGDFVVIGALVLRPGAVVEGRAIAYGSTVANSSLADVRGGRMQFLDVGFAATETAPGVLALDHRSLEAQPVRAVTLPGILGLRVPTYDRVNGLSLAFGPEIATGRGALRVEPNVTYRSQLGALDPGVDVLWTPRRRTTIAASARRATLTNDAWIYSDLVNTATSLFAGRDTRNYYRADRAEASVERRIETAHAVVAPRVGALLERAWSVTRDASTPSAPWSMIGRRDTVDGIRRPNPGVTGGSIASALAGVEARVLTGAIPAQGWLAVEVPVHAPGDARFAQLTLDGSVSVPTFRDQALQLFAHALTTFGDRAPSQRWGYLGGGGSIPTLPMLAEGGDQLAWLESRYLVPITGVRLPFVGSPRLMLRHIVGGAGVDRLPALAQNVGVRVGLGPLRVDYVLDPAHPGRHEASFGFGVR